MLHPSQEFKSSSYGPNYGSLPQCLSLKDSKCKDGSSKEIHIRYSASINKIQSSYIQSMLMTFSLPEMPSPDRRASPFLTSMNILCLIQGVSVFAIPYVTARGGISVLISIVVVALMDWYGMYLITKCQYQISKSTPGACKRVYATYIDIGKAVFPKYGRKIMAAVTMSTALTAVSFFILLGQITADLLQRVTDDFNVSIEVGIVIWACLIYPWFFITKVSVMAWFSTIALFSLTAAILLCCGVLIANYQSWDMANISFDLNLEYLMLGYGIISNSYFLHLIVPAIEGSITDPKSFTKASVLSYTFNTIFKVGFALLGVLTFGLTLKQSITSNLTSSLPVFVSICTMTAVNLYFSFPIALCVVFEMLDQFVLPHFYLFNRKGKSYRLWVALSRLFILLSVTFMAVSVPQFGLVVSFIGTARGTFVAILFPVYFYLKLRWRHVSFFSKVSHVVFMIFGLIMGVGGAYFSLRSIIKKSP